jgi:integrase
LRDIKSLHIEDYKRQRSAGAISEQRTAADEAREQQLRSELARNPKRRTMKANAKYGWLGRHTVHSRVSVRIVNYELRCLFTFFRWAVKQNHLFVNPVTNIEKFRMPKRSLPRFMTSEEIRKFFAACREDERRLFSTILLTGMRKGEIEHLTWTDLNFDLGILFIQAKPRRRLAAEDRRARDSNFADRPTASFRAVRQSNQRAVGLRIPPVNATATSSRS